LRNGPNPKSGTSGHWFFGDGMVHGVCLRDGRALWYRNRWVRTSTFTDGVQAIHPDGTRDLKAGVANTHVMAHAGKIFALVESSLPTELTRELDTIGPYDFDGKLHTAMTAHPKICAATGELHFFGYDWMQPWLVYHRANAAGELVQSEIIEVPGPTMMHDFAITDRHVIFMDLPIVFDLERAMQGTMPYRWSDDYGARVGIMPRGGKSADVRWFEVEPCYVFHPFNAFAEGATITVDVARYPHLWRDSPGSFDPARAHRWTFDLANGSVRETPLDDRAIEFPRIDERRTGIAARYGYAAQSGSSVAHDQTALVKYDLETGKCETHEFGPGYATSEAVFVSAGPSAGEDEGWVLAYVYDAARDSSDLVVLDARDFAGKPRAVVALPQRVPMGFHGSWVAADAETASCEDSSALRA
jgi:carotenoid cleavage dioxygenase